MVDIDVSNFSAWRLEEVDGVPSGKHGHGSGMHKFAAGRIRKASANGKSPLPQHVNSISSPQPLNTPTQVAALHLAGLAMQSPSLGGSLVAELRDTPANSPASTQASHRSQSAASSLSQSLQVNRPGTPIRTPKSMAAVYPTSCAEVDPMQLMKSPLSMSPLCSSPWKAGSRVQPAPDVAVEKSPRTPADWCKTDAGDVDSTDSEPQYILDTGLEKGLRSGIVGGVISNLLKMFVRRKLDSCGKLHVTIGGNSLQLLSGKTTGFRVYMQNFCFEGCHVTEAEAHTLKEAGRIEFNLGSARSGGKLLSKRVPMQMSMRIKEDDATAGMQLDGNRLLRRMMQEFWNSAMQKHRSTAHLIDGPDLPSQSHLPLPAFHVTYTNGLALYEEILDQSMDASCHDREPGKVALRFKIEKIDGKEQLLVQEAEWPEEQDQAPGGKLGAQAVGTTPRKPTRLDHAPLCKVMKLPSDIRFQSFTVEHGWMSFTYTFELDL